MTEKDERLWRLACAIQEQWTTNQAGGEMIDLPVAAWEELQKVTRQLRLVRRKYWRLAEATLSNDLHRLLHQVQSELLAIENNLTQPLLINRSSSLADIHADLNALEVEFGKISFDRRARTLSVTTEPIELDEVFLGPFEIRLNWATMSDPYGRRYRIIALDPHPAASNDSVTHPHVQSENLCEGDGHQPILAALKQGRLLDFFLLIANILRTYNSSSPYISLEDWHGVDCTECGNTIHDEENWNCERCGTTLCDGCVHSCYGCESSLCSDCIVSCSGCQDYFCNSCLKVCSHCESDFCSGCLHDNEICTDCHERQTEESADATDTEAAEAAACANATLQPDSLGETALPA